MAEKMVNTDLRVVNGGTLYMPPWEEGNDKWGNLALPDVYAKGTVQLYPTGTIYRKGLRTFVYTLTDAVYYQGPPNYRIAGYLMESCSERKDLGGKVITATIGENTITVNMGGACAKDAYAGGMIGIVMGAGLTVALEGGCSQFQIISNTKQDASNYVTFTLDGILPATYPTDSNVVITEHPYAKVRMPQTNPYTMCVGVLICTSAGGNYLWLQTGGPCNMIHCNATFEGDVVYSVPAHVVGASINRPVDGATSTTNAIEHCNMQRIGNSYASTDIGGPGGAPADTKYTESIWLDILN